MNWEMREYHQEFSEGGNKNFFRSRGSMPLKTRLMMIGGLMGGIAVGTFLFLFFLTIFLYVFVPVAAILIFASLIQRFLKR